MATKTFRRGANTYEVKSVEGKVQSILNTTTSQKIPLDTDTAYRILKGDRRYIEVKK